MSPEQMTAIAADIEDVLLRVHCDREDTQTLERIVEDLYTAADSEGLEDRAIVDRHRGAA